MQEIIEESHKEALEQQFILFDISNSVLTITLNRPQVSNGLTSGMYTAIRDALNRANGNPEIRAVILRGNGKHFCSGNDLNNFSNQQILKLDPLQNAKYSAYHHLQLFCEAFINFNKPLIAVVQGACVGVGFTFLAFCDYVIAEQSTFFDAPLVQLAQGPEMCASEFFPQIFGQNKAFELIVMGKRLVAEDALKYGFVSIIAADSQSAGVKLNEYLQALLELDQDSIQGAKQLLVNKQQLRRCNQAEMDNLVLRWSSPNLKPAIMKFFMQKSQNAVPQAKL